MGLQANGKSYGAAIGQHANGNDYGAALGCEAYGEQGVAVGWQANGYQGVAAGNLANGKGNGTALGREAYASDNGVAVGFAANGYQGAAVGYRANGYQVAALGQEANAYLGGAALGKQAKGLAYGAAIGEQANGSAWGAVVGYQSDASSHGAAIGYQADGSGYGAAVGESANGSNHGSAIGNSANGANFGVSVGEGAYALNYGVAIGYVSSGAGSNTVVGFGAQAVGGSERIAIGHGVVNTQDNSAVMRGTLYLDGGTNVFWRETFGSGAWNALSAVGGGMPAAHATHHQNGGDDEINVAGLSGVLADGQNATQLWSRLVSSAAPGSGQALKWSGTAWGPANDETGTFSYVESDPVWTNAEPGYLKVNGTRAMAGNLNMGGFSITNVGNNSIVFANGMAISTGTVQNWNTAYGWGNHAGAGYLKTETDPVFGASVASQITASDTSHWSVAYGWGNHAAAGYITGAGSSNSFVKKSGDTMSGALNINVGGANDLVIGSAGTGVSIGNGANGSAGAAVGSGANGNLGGAVGSSANGWGGAAVGSGANGYNGVAMGYTANGYDFGVALGESTRADNHGVALGVNANGRNVNVALGSAASCQGGTERIAIGHGVTNTQDNSAVVRGTLYLDGGTSVLWRATFGSGAWTPLGGGGGADYVLKAGDTMTGALNINAGGAHDLVIGSAGAGVSIGNAANGSLGAAVGAVANGYNGVAIGYTANGYDYGVALGESARADNHGVAVGASANGSSYGTALGQGAVAVGSTRAAVGNGVQCTADNTTKVLGNLEMTCTDGNIYYNDRASFKRFVIDHPLDPENKVLRHACLEGPVVQNVYNGTVVLNEKGEATVKLPDYFEALNKNPQYMMTAVSMSMPGLFVKQKVRDNTFVIGGGVAGGEVCWEVKGERNDPAVRDNPLTVEERKVLPGRLYAGR